jgi:serine/threonine protein kinase
VPASPFPFHDLLDDFEAAWQRGSRPALADYLPPEDHPRRQEMVLELLKLDLEYRLQAGQTAPLLPVYRRQEGVALSKADQVALIALEYQRRWERGERVSRAEYLDRFPDLAAELQALSPCWDCETPGCPRTRIPLQDESAETVTCPVCGGRFRVAELFTPAAGLPAGDAAAELNLRGYELSERLGRGGIGEVYLSRDPRLGRTLAVKVLRPEYQGNPEVERRFEEEARITARLDHPNIVPLHVYGRLPDGRLGFTMRLIEGRTLAELLGDRSDPKQDLGRFLGIFQGVCQAVAFAHFKGVIHRDLKPGNVMVGRSGEGATFDLVQVMDWGMAKVLRPPPDGGERTAGTGAPEEGGRRPGPGSTGDETAAGQALGTPGYMAPEQARGERERVNERTDVFGLGAVLCEILTGLPPYWKSRDDRPNQAEALRRARAGELGAAEARLDGCLAGKALVQLARDCLRAEPAGRPPHGGAVARRVAEYLEKDKRKRRRKLLVLTAALTALLVAAVSAAVWRLDSLATGYVHRILGAEPNDSLRPVIDEVQSTWYSPLLATQVASRLRGELDQGWRKIMEPDSGPAEDERGKQLANAAAALALLGETEVLWPLLEHSPDPRLRYLLIGRLVTAEVPPETLVQKLHALLPGPAAAEDASAGIRQALILCLGRFDTLALPEKEKLASPSRSSLLVFGASTVGLLAPHGQGPFLALIPGRDRPTLPPDLKRYLLNELAAAYRADPDPGVHSAIDWVLRRWQVAVRPLDEALSQERGEAQLMARLGRGDLSWRWYVTQHLHTMVVVDARKYDPQQLGLPPLPYLFAISSKEVSFEQYEKFNKPRPSNPTRALDRPVNMLGSEAAFTYCDQLTTVETSAAGPFFGPGAASKAGRTVLLEEERGYRLPSGAEWEYACRGGSVTRRFFGNTVALMDEFAWSHDNSSENWLQNESAAGPVGRLMPNQLGLFDIYGNVGEYCIDSPFRSGIGAVTARGGSFTDHREIIDSRSHPQVKGDKSNGWRIARTLWKFR